MQRGYIKRDRNKHERGTAHLKDERKFLRQCRVCRTYKDRNLLIRITRDYKTGEYIVNTENAVEGRSLYVCKDKECIAKLLKNKKLLELMKLKTCKDIEERLTTVLTE